MIEWDRNKDGGIDSKEFRICMRGLGGHLKDIDVREIDGLFETLDTDHSGEISIKELKSAIKRMQQESRMRATEAARSRNTAQKLTTAAELFRDAAAQKVSVRVRMRVGVGVRAKGEGKGGGAGAGAGAGAVVGV